MSRLVAVLQQQVAALLEENALLRSACNDSGFASASGSRPRRRRSSFKAGVLSVRKADATDCIDPAFALKVLDLLNNAYRRGEKGLLVEPWSRACKEDVTELLTGNTDAQGSQFMLIAEFVPGVPIGCAKVSISRKLRRGEVGLLAVDMEYQRRGVAKAIMGKAEEACAVTRCSNLDLELLVPVDTEHEFKSLVVKKWYQRLGFEKQSSEVVKAGTEMPCRTKPKVAVDCEVEKYTKPIRRDSLSISTAYRIQTITEAELKKRITAKSAVIVDVRGKDFIGGHITGAKNLPFEDNSTFADKIKALGTDSGAAVVFYCMYSKQYSPLAASMFVNHLKEAKVTKEVFILTGGFHRWLNTQSAAELQSGTSSMVTDYDAGQFVDLKGGNGLVHNFDCEQVDVGSIDSALMVKKEVALALPVGSRLGARRASKGLGLPGLGPNGMA